MSRCLVANDNRLRCKLQARHDGPHDFDGDERRESERERNRLRARERRVREKRERPVRKKPRRVPSPKPCPGCGKTHPGPRCDPEKRRQQVQVSLPPDVLAALHVAADGLGQKGKSDVATEALRVWFNLKGER